MRPKLGPKAWGGEGGGDIRVVRPDTSMNAVALVLIRSACDAQRCLYVRLVTRYAVQDAMRIRGYTCLYTFKLRYELLKIKRIP